jgi:serine/threonine protein kinase
MNFKEKYTILASLSNQKKRKFSEVYACEDGSSKEQFVLKQVMKNPHNTLEQERLRSEASFSFQKEGLPVICDIFEDENSIQVVKKYEAGIPLNEFLSDLTPRKRRTVLGQLMPLIADLLGSIHEQKILHLDIKPSNILVAKLENSYRVALIDFGMAIRMDQLEERKTLFPLGYAAPELVLNQLHCCDKTSDYFSLGITIWHCLTGQLPLYHSNPSVFTNLQINHPLPESSLIPKKPHELLAKLCAKYSFEIPPNQLSETEMIKRLDKAKKERYQDLMDFINDWNDMLQRKWWQF